MRPIVGVAGAAMVVCVAMLSGHAVSSTPAYRNDAQVTIDGSPSRDVSWTMSGMETSPGGAAAYGGVTAYNKGTRPATLLAAAFTSDSPPQDATVKVGLYDFQARRTGRIGVDMWPSTVSPRIGDGDLVPVRGFLLQPGKAIQLIFVARSDAPGVHRWERVRMSFRYHGKTKTDEVRSGFELCVSRRCPAD